MNDFQAVGDMAVAAAVVVVVVFLVVKWDRA